MLGVAYKKNVDDIRESPAFALWELMREKGADVGYYDPHVPEIPPTREHASFAGEKSVAWDPDSWTAYDAVLICTDHDDVDYDMVVKHAQLVIDTRNATRDVVQGRDKIVKA